MSLTSDLSSLESVAGRLESMVSGEAKRLASSLRSGLSDAERKARSLESDLDDCERDLDRCQDDLKDCERDKR